MKYFIFLILFLPFAGAVTVAPAVLVEDMDTVIVVNRLDEEAHYTISGAKASPEEFTLQPGERMLVEVQHEKKEATLFIDEHSSSNIVSSAAIKIMPRKRSNLHEWFHARTGLPLRTVAICALGGIVLIIAVVLIRRFL